MEKGLVENKEIIKLLNAGKKIYQCKKCKTNIAGFQKPKICICGHTELIQIDRESIDNDFTIIIEVYYGCVTDVKNLPKGWKYQIKNFDQR